MEINYTKVDEFLCKSENARRKIALLLDYDGTLSPIAPRPELATLPEDTRQVLERLSRRRDDLFVAIISGRAVSNVREMAGIEGITYGGNHGLEIQHADGTAYIHPLPGKDKENLAKAKKELQEQACHDGSWIEDKNVQLTFHYRQVPEEIRPVMVEKAKKIIAENGFKVGLAHCALECKPKVEWNKGNASLLILEKEFGTEWDKSVRAIFAGDDVTDEDAFRALEGKGLGIRIGDEKALSTAAGIVTPTTESFLQLLKYIEGKIEQGSG